MITITRRSLAEIVILDLAGRLIGEAGNDFLAIVTPQIVELGVRKLVLNFSALTQCDSMGISALLRIHRSLENMDGKMVICNPNALIEKVFALTRIDEVLHLESSETEALAHFAVEPLLHHEH